MNTPRYPDDHLLLALFDQHDRAENAVEEIIAADFPMDRISLLGRAGSGDDPLGLYYPGRGERMKGWGALGAFWGGLFGLFSGAVGLFVLPGVGAVAAAGSLVEALAGAATGAALGGGVMAGAAAVDQLAVALHRHGVPEDRLAHLQQAVADGRYVVLLRGSEEELARWTERLRQKGAESVELHDYRGLRDVL
jgi:hypothetical protein